LIAKSHTILFKYSFCSSLEFAACDGRTVPHPTPIQSTPLALTEHFLGGYKNDTRYH